MLSRGASVIQNTGFRVFGALIQYQTTHRHH